MSRNLRAIIQIKKMNELLTMGGVFLMSIVMVLIVFFVADEAELGDSLRILWIGFFAGGYCMMNLFIKIFIMTDEVPKGLSFGMTRHTLFIYSRLVDLAEIIFMAIVATIGLGEIDSMVFKIAALFFGLFMWLEGTAGNSVIRYGKMAYWIYYIVVMLVSIGLPRLTQIFPEIGDAIGSAVMLFVNTNSMSLSAVSIFSSAESASAVFCLLLDLGSA